LLSFFSNHRIRLKKGLVNGLTGPSGGGSGSGGGGGGGGGNPHHSASSGGGQSTDLMDGFDGLVGEDGVLTFVDQVRASF